MKKKYLTSKIASLSPINSLRRGIYKRAGYKIGKNVSIARNVKILAKELEIGDNARIADGVFISSLRKVKIGEFTEISQNVIIDGDNELEIGDNCFIGTGYHINVRDKVTLEDSVALGGSGGQIWTHSTWPEEIDGHQINKISSVHIGKNSWIGTKAIIHPGVKIGQNSIIGSNSLVTTDIPENTLAFGNPATPIKKVSEMKKDLKDWEKEDILMNLVKRFIDTYGGQYQKTEIGIMIKDRNETAIISMKKIEPEEIAKFDSKTAYFDIERKRCSKKNIKLERNFRRFANYYSARFKSE
ncbi:MAG: acyltransferase [Nanoarchaeota archaeon]|nr:acyltransferase [Nanoarchaeota archaeon]MBU1135667.1 acyltransferase [Nanoarchaeota archaeon]MBU2520541.1 acyltransferase [Nanoarchaeota archaeon]